MKFYPEPAKPFAFWLVQQFLPVENTEDENSKPISDREFYTYISIVGFALALFGIFLHAF